MRSLARRIPAVVWSGIFASLLTMLAGGVWTALLIANLAINPAIPWAVAVMAILLWLMWRYLGGSGWPRSTAEARRQYRRANPVSAAVFTWALVAGALALVALTGLWIVLVQLVKVPDHALPDFSRYPWFTVALVIAMSSLVNSVGEEAGFRGYFQVALERAVPVPVAIVITSLVMAPAHGLTQGFLWPTLLFYFLVDAMLGALAYLTDSILPGIVIHAAGLLLFFTLVWPQDPLRQLVAEGSAEAWFWIHTAQAILFAALALLAFRHLARITEPARAGRMSKAALQQSNP
jgi:membrane protease YdiL (CAAX protease family)